MRFLRLRLYDTGTCSQATVQYFCPDSMDPANQSNFNPREWFFHVLMGRAPSLLNLIVTNWIRAPAHRGLSAWKSSVIAIIARGHR